jgi:glyoxylase-like metal-dependent hydrolase (beta-lactamase superfamily II)
MKTANPVVHTFFHEPTFTATHVVRDPSGRAAAIVDPVLDFDHKSGRTGTSFADMIVDWVRANSLEVKWILETHAHADHLTAAPYLKDKLGGRIGVGSRIMKVQKKFKDIFNLNSSFVPNGTQFDKLFHAEEEFKVGDLVGRVMFTPGHTPACVTYVIGNAAFVGDTLFMPDYGTARTDFPGGDAAELYRSISKIFSLPGDTRLFLCHDYKAPGRKNFTWETTVAEQRAKNIHVRDGISEAEFVAMRKARDAKLDMPLLILPSIQVNIRAGRLPPPEGNGVAYLKIPLNAL